MHSCIANDISKAKEVCYGGGKVQGTSGKIIGIIFFEMLYGNQVSLLI